MQTKKIINSDIIQSYMNFDQSDGLQYMFHIDEDFESKAEINLSINEKLIKRTTYDGFETYEDALIAYQNILNEKHMKIMSKYVSIF